MNLKKIQQLFHEELDTRYGENEVNSFFFMLTEHYFQINRLALALTPTIEISEEQEQLLITAKNQLLLFIPIQHIIGEAIFFDMVFKVNQHVLVPRRETEELVSWILEDINDGNTKAIDILDIGTGSGCIPIAIAKNIPEASISSIDISQEALNIAQLNATSNEVKVNFIHDDILAVKYLTKKWDIIVSNPPYVRELEKEAMDSNVVLHEPHLALFVENKAPLVFYKKIAALAVDNLKEDGSVYVEINQYLGKETKAVFEQAGFKTVLLKKDMFGNDRMIKATKK
jgi:release factor glutamine methyltransferase